MDRRRGGEERKPRSRRTLAGRSFVQTLLETCSFGGVARVHAFDPEEAGTPMQIGKVGPQRPYLSVRVCVPRSPADSLQTMLPGTS